MYALLFNSVTPAVGEAHLVDFPDILQNVNVQIDPSTNITWTVEISARLGDDLPWEVIKTVADDDTPLDLLFEVPSFPQYRAELVAVTGDPAVPVKVALHYAPVAAAVLTTVRPGSEHTALNPPPPPED